MSIVELVGVVIFVFTRSNWEVSQVLVSIEEETMVNIGLELDELDHQPPPPQPGQVTGAIITGGLGSWTLIVTVIGLVVQVPSVTI